MKSIELVNNKNFCCGCGLCAQKCPKNAIEMKEDEKGFVYPYIDKAKCINCNICKKVCEYNKKNKENEYEKKVYVACSNDSQILNSTASGGVFSAIAYSFFNKDGVVFGSSLEKENEKFIIKHIKADSLEKLNRLKGSKYAQSDITNVYEEVQAELDKGKKVLFSGTPCQISAIKKYVHDTSNLFTIDIICHGVPSNSMFVDYIKYTNSKNNIKIDNFKFRDKSKGWGSYYYNYSYFDLNRKKHFEKIEAAYNSSYYQLFLDSYFFRENCYSCSYANDNRVGDITIGDYWGIEIEHPQLINDKEIDVNTGISCLIVNSEKGEKLIKDFSEGLVIYKSNFEKVRKHNVQLNHPCVMKEERKQLLDDYEKEGYEAIEKFYKHKYGKKNFIKNIWFKIPKKIRRLIKM